MIRICVVSSHGDIKKITLSGHACYSEYGKDIVCAAVSATYLCTINGIFSISNDSIKVSKKKETQIIEVINVNDIVNKLLNNMINCFLSLEKEYPKNISIKSKEE